MSLCVYVCACVWWRGGGCGGDGGGIVLRRSLGESCSLSGKAKAAFLIYSVSILHDMQNKLWKEEKNIFWMTLQAGEFDIFSLTA